MLLHFTELMLGVVLEGKMSSNAIRDSDFIRARKKVEKWGLDLHMEAGDEGDDIVYSVKNRLFSSIDIDDIIEWINEEFEEK